MAGTSVYDAIVKFVGDMSGVDAALAGIPGKAGTTGAASGQSFGSKFGGILKTTLGSLAGAGIGAAVGMALNGANQLDAATKQLQADTGMTATDAAKAETAIAGLYQNNLQGFADIGSAMSAVITQLHLTGDAATAATQLFLDFSTATGQNAADAVDNVSKALDAWNLSADQAGPLMDKLIAGHQNFKLSVTDSETALKMIAPAMQAMGMSMDDGIGLLNLFASSGIDASKASLALATAIKVLKPGQTLNDLIAQISSISDPLKRAQVAAHDFGARAGAQLADALKPGITSLSQFETTANQNADATQKAADAIDSGFGAQMTLLLHKAGGALADLGTQFGGLAMVASAFGPTFTRIIGAAIGGIAPLLVGSMAGLLPSFSAIGLTQGTAIGAGAVTGEVTTIVAGQATVAAAVAPAAATAGAGIGAAIGTAMATAAAAALVIGLPIAIAALLLAANDANNKLTDPTTIADKSRRGYQDIFASLPPMAANAGKEAGNDLVVALTTAYVGGQPSFGKALDDTALAVSTFAQGITRTASQSAAEMMGSFQSMAAGWAAQWSELDSIATAAVADIFGTEDRAAALSATNQKIADDKKILSSKNATAAQKAAAEAELLTLTQTAEQEQIVMAGHGELTKTQYAALISELNKQASSSNEEVANSAKLVLAELANLQAQADATASSLKGVIYGGAGQTKKNAAGGFIAAGETSLINELGQELYAPRGSYFTAPADGYIIPAGPSAAIMAGTKGGTPAAPLIGQQTNHIYGVQPGDVEIETRRALRRAQLESSLAGGRG